MGIEARLCWFHRVNNDKINKPLTQIILHKIDP